MTHDQVRTPPSGRRHELVPRYLSKSLAAAYLTMSETTFDENLKRGAFPPPIRLPTGALKWDREDIDAAMEALKNGISPANDSSVRSVRKPPEGRREAS
jgi:predicted DNA-binding transcriptional regulator AlpA